MSPKHLLLPATLLTILVGSSFFLIHEPKPNAPAYTSDMADFTCPIDGKKFKSEVCMSRTTFGRYRDFAERGAIGNYYKTIIHQCPACRFSGFQSDFDSTYTAAEKEAIRAAVAPYTDSKKDQAGENEVAAKIWSAIHRHEARIPDAYLWASYILRDSRKADARKEYQLKAADAFAAIHKFENDSSGMMKKCAIRYLSADLYRRGSQFDKSVAYFDSAFAVPIRQEGIDIWIKEQRDLALAHNDKNDI